MLAKKRYEESIMSLKEKKKTKVKTLDICKGVIKQNIKTKKY